MAHNLTCTVESPPPHTHTHTRARARRSDPHVNHSSSSSGRRVATPTSTRESSRSNSPQSVKSLPATISSRDGVGKNRSSPRLLDKAHLSILSHLGTKGAESREKSAPGSVWVGVGVCLCVCVCASYWCVVSIAASMRISPSSGTTRSPSPRGRGARTTPPPSARDVSPRPGHHEAVDSNEIVSVCMCIQLLPTIPLSPLSGSSVKSVLLCSCLLRIFLETWPERPSCQSSNLMVKYIVLREPRTGPRYAMWWV